MQGCIVQAREIKQSYVPAHCVIAGNELADKLAREGSANTFIGPEQYLGILFSTPKELIVKWREKEHRKVWNNYKEGKHTKQHLKYPSNR